ncbi:MAG: sensor histidine kinase [Salinarimonadaceae bacterium]|nr:MAG: sensor histidine kinase [Salinarimonadaceae bacterium]
MGGLGRLFRTTAFKLSLFYLAIFAVTIFLTLGYVAWNAQRLVNAQVIDAIEAEITGLAEQFERGGVRQLVRTINRRSRTPGASLYLITTRGGASIAGNVENISPRLLETPGQRRIEYQQAAGEEVEPRVHRAVVRVYHLPGGFRLLVGRDLEENERLREVIRRAFGWSVLLVGLFGGLGAWVVSKRMLKRVDDMTQTTRGIMAGDLGGRLAVAGTRDELDRLAESLNAMLDRIGELLTGMRQVSDNIAHDLKTPLTRLRNRADEALRTARSPDELRAALEATIEESDNLIRVFNALLMIARLEAGAAADMVVGYDAAEVVGGVAELYEAAAEEAGMRLVADVSPDLPVKGSRELLGQAVANLIDNAIKYGRRKDGNGEPDTIAVSARREGERVLIDVTDHGPGIPEADLERAQERFVRLESARTRPGFGLGLSLVAGVARLHDGSLLLENAGPGLKATLDLPLSSPAPSPM